MDTRGTHAPTRTTTTGDVTGTTGITAAAGARNHSPQRNAMRRTTTSDDDNQMPRVSRRSLSIRLVSAAKRSKSNRNTHQSRAPTERLRATLRKSLSRLSIAERPRKVQSSPVIHVGQLVEPGERAKIYMAAADEAARVGDILAAQEHLRDVLRNCIDVSPHTTAEVLALLGIVADRLGHLKEAEILLNESLGKSGDIQSFVPLFVLAGIYQRTGREDEADRLLAHGNKFRKFLVQ